MKTKHILTALALPTVFAACTADDIVSENNAMQQMERAKLSKDFVLNFSNDGVESRYAVEGTTKLDFVFEEGDKIGANLIDLYAPIAGKESTFDPKDPATWTIVNTVSPALPFIYQGGAWVSANEELGIGNYLFTNPFNPADKNRGAASYELPVVVEYSSANPNAHIEKFNKAVAAQVLREGETNATASLKNIFAYPNIRINFEKGLEVTKVTKVILAKENGEFIYKGAFNHQAVVDIFNPKALEAYLKENKKKTEADYWAQFQTSNFIIDLADNTDWADMEAMIEATKNYATIKTTPYFIYEMNETVKSNSIDIRFIIPSIADLSNEDNSEKITLYVCTDKGNYEFELTDLNNYKFSDTTLQAMQKAAMQRNTSYTLKTVALDKTNESDDTFFTDNIVSTAADWNALVEKYGDLKKYSAEYNKKDENGQKINADALPLNVTILDDDFALTSDLKMPEVAEFIITSEVGVEGAVTLKNIKMDNANLIVKKGATLTTDATLIAPTVEVEEGGNLVFAAVYNEEEELEAYTGIATVNNEGTVTVPAGVEATFALNNACKDAVLNVGAAASRAAEVADAVANLSGSNYGIINNYSVINVLNENTFTNNAPVESEEIGYEWDTEEKVWDAAPTINNFATFNAKGTVVNNGLFVNNSVLTSNFVGNASFTNATAANQTHEYKGTLDIKAGAETYIDNNQGAVIILAEHTPAKGLTIYKARKNADFQPSTTGNYLYRGMIKYILNEKPAAALDLSASPVNYLVANTDVEIGKTYTWVDNSGTTAKTKTYALETLEVTDGIVTLAARTGAGTDASPYAYPAQVGTLVVNGEVEVDGEYYTKDGAHIGEINVNAGGVFTLPSDATLQIALANIILALEDTQKKLNAAKMYVNGTLILTDSYPTSTVYDNNVWPATGTDGVYKTTDFGKNIEVKKGVEVKCVANTQTTDNGAVGEDIVVFTTATLNTVKEQQDFKDVDGNDTYTFVIGKELDMSVKDNKDNVSVLTNAKVVELRQGSSITNLDSDNLITLNKLVNNRGYQGIYHVEGTANLVVLKVNELELNQDLRVLGWIEIADVVAQEGMGCNKITVAEGKTVTAGKVVAKDVDSKYLEWDFSSKTWKKLVAAQ